MMADGLSRVPGEPNTEVQVVASKTTVDPVLVKVQKEQWQDEELSDLIEYLEDKVLPDCPMSRQKMLAATQRGLMGYCISSLQMFQIDEE